MNQNKMKIGNLTKVTLGIEVGASSERNFPEQKAFSFEFIFGLGTEGLTPFECELADKAEGDEILLNLEQAHLRNTFERICFPFHQLSGQADTFSLKARVLKVMPAENREVIKALAQMAACDHGGEGCGDSCCHFH
jgi:hypothetical protein